MGKLLSTIDKLSMSSTRSCRSVSCFDLVGEVRATNSPSERVGVGHAGVDERTPSCLRMEGEIPRRAGAGPV